MDLRLSKPNLEARFYSHFDAKHLDDANVIDITCLLLRSIFLTVPKTISTHILTHICTVCGLHARQSYQDCACDLKARTIQNWFLTVFESGIGVNDLHSWLKLYYNHWTESTVKFDLTFTQAIYPLQSPTKRYLLRLNFCLPSWP